MSKKPEIAVVGATGVIGMELLAAIASTGHPSDSITALASERSAGRELEFGDETIEVEAATEESFRGVGLAYFATPAEVSKVLAKAAQSAGSWAVDLSSAFRLEEGVPLVLPAVNLALLRGQFRGRIVSCPSAITTALVTALEPLRVQFGFERAFVTAMLGVSSSGTLGLDELQRQTADMLSGREPEVVRFPHRIGFNLIPQVGDFSRSAEWSSEELSWSEEAARIWSAPQLPPLVGTAVQAPTFYGHLLTVEIQLASAPGIETVREALKSSANLKVLDAPIERVYPMPMLASGDSTVHVGRVRELRGWKGGFTFVIAVDNARRGGALNAIEIGQALLRREELS